MTNEVLINGIMYKLESIWRKSKNDKTKDSRGNKYPFPKEETGWSASKHFVDRLNDVQTWLDMNPNMDTTIIKERIYDECLDCILCNEKCITDKKYYANSFFWENGLIHYILKHNIKPSDDFINMIYKFEIIKDTMPIKIIGRSKAKATEKYVKIDTNQIMILDALMRHGGYTKKYIDTKKKSASKYSEHAGILDLHDTGLNKIIVSGNTNRIDRGDEEIFLPNDLPEMLEYEYIFHTHPPTPKPGGRASDGILYEFPSTGDLFHFIDHFNDGQTIGSLVMTPEGLYNIRKFVPNKKPIEIDEDEFYSEMKKVFKDTQDNALLKYGTKFSSYEFYSKIAQDTSFIENINSKLNKYNITIDYYPRKKDNKGNWVVTTLYLKIFNV
jgi:hypothetical protein